MMDLMPTRRRLMAGLASGAGVALIGRPVIAWPAHAEEPHGVFEALKETLVCRFERFVAIDKGEIATGDDLTRWQMSYDELIGAADVLRDEITDDAPGRDDLIEFARVHVMPPCERAILYRFPVQGMSDEFVRLATAYFIARRDLICWTASMSPREAWSDLMRPLTASLRALQTATPQTRPDRIALRRVIEALNNNDAADVSMVRSTLEPYDLRDFRSWARSCGSFTCVDCEAWLGTEGIS